VYDILTSLGHNYAFEKLLGPFCVKNIVWSHLIFWIEVDWRLLAKVIERRLLIYRLSVIVFFCLVCWLLLLDGYWVFYGSY